MRATPTSSVWGSPIALSNGVTCQGLTSGRLPPEDFNIYLFVVLTFPTEPTKQYNQMGRHHERQYERIHREKLLQHASQIIKTYANKYKLSQDQHFRVSCGKKYSSSIKNNNINSRFSLQMNLHQLQDTIKFALDTSFFRVGSVTIKQSRGAGIGNPMSPMICEGSILATEFRWRSSEASRSIIPVRYVDNLFSLQLEDYTDQTQEFKGWDPQFYIPPISLEQCEVQDEYLGCRLFLSQGVLQSLYVVRKESWRYPHSGSAGTNNRLTTGLHSRLHAAYKLSFPKQLQVKAIHQLISLYIKLGHNRAFVTKIVNKFKAKHKLFTG